MPTEPPVFALAQGSIPRLVPVPDMGTRIPDDIAATMTPVARHYDDTDVHLDRLYAFAKTMGAAVLQPTYSRYVVDLNRPPDGASLYPGQDTTGLLPIDTFNKEALYPTGGEPDEAERARRLERYWKHNHDALEREHERIKNRHGQILYRERTDKRSEGKECRREWGA